MRPEIVDKVANFPDAPGVYVFTDARGRALYVGKSSRLRARVRSYLKPGGDGRPMLRFLEREAHDVEFLAVRTEQEALLLEDTIVKKRKPLYNVKLRDDKSFLLLRLDRREDWPWFRLVRRRRDDGAEYFGPFASAKAVRRTLQLLHKVAPLRDCKDGVFHNRSRPCVKHEIGRCPAPCVGLVTRADYDVSLDEATAVLRGRAGPVLARLRAEMAGAAERLEFERAQVLRDQIEALERVQERQAVVAVQGDQDVLGLYRTDDGTSVTIAQLMFRGGRLESARRHELSTALPDELLLGDLLPRLYLGDRFVPPEIVVPAQPAEVELIEDWLAGKRGADVAIRVPQRGRSLRHLEIAQENARLTRAAAAAGEAAQADAGEALAALLELTEPPQRIHCLDVSTTQGRGTVASRVCFVDGRPAKDWYRRLRIADEHAGDDFAAMEEAVQRSVRRCLDGVDDLLPDLLIVDGGAGQLAAAGRALASLGLAPGELPVVGLAKSRLRGAPGDRRERSDERLFVPGRGVPIHLDDGSPPWRLVTALRDEAHRFAITYHRQLRGRVASVLDDIPGVGPSRRRLLLRRFGSLSGVRAASLDQLRAVDGLPAAVAERVHRALAAAPADDVGEPAAPVKRRRRADGSGGARP
ncbi:MAG: excinuclease ABC subunit UvrC [Planctomycetes bacterium]|nr:excinuclease ABC subunit UvrC [Planctomycetota bacterium]